jgi:hypothetical protein
MTFELQALPANEGDSLLLSWGEGTALHRMLTDGGRLFSYQAVHDRIAALGSPGKPPHLDLIVITHIDADHIEGVIRLLQDAKALKLSVDDVWFNGWPQIANEDLLGADYGEMVGALLTKLKLPWNHAFTGAPAMAPKDDPLTTVTIGGATLTLLSPGPTELRKLRANWTKVLAAAGQKPGDGVAALARLAQRPELAGLEHAGDVLGEKTPLDNSVANGSSIGMLVEFDGHSVLMTGDGHGDVLAKGIRRLLKARKLGVLPVDVVKLPHHCSAGNVTEDFLSLLDSGRFVISTNGARYNHPDETAVMRVLNRPHHGRGTELIFDYLSDTTKPWAAPATQRKLKYTATYPAAGESGVIIDVGA